MMCVDFFCVELNFGDGGTFEGTRKLKMEAAIEAVY